jgi:hypothetical protein
MLDLPWWNGLQRRAGTVVGYTASHRSPEVKHTIFIAVFAVGVAGTASAGSEKDAQPPRPEITQLKEMYLRTALTAEGRAACAIVPPADPAYLPLARKLAEAVKQACGVAPPIRAAEEVARQMPPGENVIALGVFANNRVVEDLYLREFVLCDFHWPGGQTSYVIRTVHNPWLNGKNVIHLGHRTWTLTDRRRCLR